MKLSIQFSGHGLPRLYITPVDIRAQELSSCVQQALDVALPLSKAGYYWVGIWEDDHNLLWEKSFEVVLKVR